MGLRSKRLLLLGVVGCCAALLVPAIGSASPHEQDPNPFKVYPRRPGAKRTDIEARPGQTVQIYGGSIAIEKSEVLPGLAQPLGVVVDQHVVVEPFTPKMKEQPTSVLHLSLLTTSIPEFVSCTLTSATDGAEATARVPHDQQILSQRSVDRFAGSLRGTDPLATATTSTTSPPLSRVEFWYAIGARRGRFYVACNDAVWAIDV